MATNVKIVPADDSLAMRYKADITELVHATGPRIL